MAACIGPVKALHSIVGWVMGHLPKLTWSRDVTGKVDNIHSNLTPTTQKMTMFRYDYEQN